MRIWTVGAVLPTTIRLRRLAGLLAVTDGQCHDVGAVDGVGLRRVGRRRCGAVAEIPGVGQRGARVGIARTLPMKSRPSAVHRPLLGVAVMTAFGARLPPDGAMTESSPG